MHEHTAAAVAAKYVPAASGAAGMILFGVPAGVLIAALLGAAMSFYFRPGTPERRIPMILFGVVSMAFAGAWLSLAAPHFTWLGIGTAAANIDPSVRAGLCALVFQSLWNSGSRFLQRKAEGA